VLAGLAETQEVINCKDGRRTGDTETVKVILIPLVQSRSKLLYHSLAKWDGEHSRRIENTSVSLYNPSIFFFPGKCSELIPVHSPTNIHTTGGHIKIPQTIYTAWRRKKQRDTTHVLRIRSYVSSQSSLLFFQ
jgi:hypothetical protein